MYGRKRQEARRAVASGVDVIVAQGWEAGGHVGSQIATLPLVPAVVDAVAPVPVIAAGGIGTLGAWPPSSPSALRRRGWAPSFYLPRRCHPPGVPHSPDQCGRDRRGVVPRSLRRRLARLAPPRPPQLDGRDVGGRGPAASGESARSGRCHRGLCFGRRDPPLRASTADDWHYR